MSNKINLKHITQPSQEQAKKTYFVWTYAQDTKVLVVDVLKEREYFQQVQYQISNTEKMIENSQGNNYPRINFRWCTHFSSKFYSYFEKNNQQQLINIFPFENEISDKHNLITNLKKFQQETQMDLADITFPTFQIDLSLENETIKNQQIQDFLEYYQQNKPADLKIEVQQFLGQNLPVRQETHQTPPQIKTTTKESSYLWIVKPSNWLQGQGIFIANSLKDLELKIKNLLKTQQSDKKDNDKKDIDDFAPPVYKKVKTESNNNTILKPQTQKNKQFFYNSSQKVVSQIVIQKYLENPLLYKKRKFDIRVVVLAANVNEFKIYMLKEGYVRTASVEYNNNAEQLDEVFMHLTNHALQKNGPDFEKFEEENILMFKQLQTYLEQCPTQQHTFQEIMSQIRKQIQIVFKSIQKKCINQQNSKNCFQIFGLDFIIDENYKVYLLEANSVPTLIFGKGMQFQNLARRMLDDAFKLTLDILFQREEKFIQQASIYPVENHSNNENLWEQIEFGL